MRCTALLLALALPLAACGGADDSVADAELEETTGEPGMLGRARSMADAMQGLEEAANRPPADPVDFRRLRAALPAEVAGLAQAGAEGGRQGTMGVAISEASADYGSEPPRYEIQITDLGALPGVGSLGLGWTMAEIDRESADGGYERTVTLGGHKGFRRYTPPDRRSFSLIVSERFHVEVDGTGVSDEDMEAALRAVDLDALAAMRDDGRGEATAE